MRDTLRSGIANYERVIAQSGTCVELWDMTLQIIDIFGAGGGLEPAQYQVPPDFESGVSSSSTTLATNW